MKILIAGAGIGGLALANGLLAEGHDVQVLESAPALREGGAAVTLFTNGHAALAGLGADLPTLGGLIETMEFRAASGSLVSRMDLRVMTRRTGFGVQTVARERLLSALAKYLPEEALSFRRAVVAVHAEATGVQVTDAQGTVHNADLLIGADGQASAVRRATVSPQSARPAGWTTWQGLTSTLPELAGGTRGLCLVGEAGLCGLMPAGDGLLQWWFDTRTPERALAPDEALKRLRELFGQFADPVPQLLETASADDLGVYPHVVHDIPDAWGSAATTLLGDAAHAFPPSQAQGANQALEDAWVLTRALRQPVTAIEAARRYEASRIPRLRRISRLAASEITNKPPSRLLRIAGRSTPPSIAGRAWLAALRRNSNVLTHDLP